jgi:hypothetical protein
LRGEISFREKLLPQIHSAFLSFVASFVKISFLLKILTHFLVQPPCLLGIPPNKVYLIFLLEHLNGFIEILVKIK